MVRNNRNRARCYVGMRNYFFETHDAEGQKISDISEDEWREKVVEEFKSVDTKELAFIFHDRDVDTDGELKKLHVHFVARFDNPRDFNSVLNQFCCDERNLTRARSEASALLYLTHTTPEAIKAKKTRYNVSELHVRAFNDNGEENELVGDSLELWYRNKIAGKSGGNAVNTEDGVAKIIDDLAEGKIVLSDVKELLREMFPPSVATMTWVKNKRHFKEAVSEHYEEKYQEWLDKGRSFHLVYIEGNSGIGKTVFARSLARRVNTAKGLRENLIHNAPNDSKGSRYDFLNGYNNEAVTVFDDLNPTTFGYTEFLNLFERERVSKYSSRFNDKAWFAEVAIITKSTSIDKWTEKLSFSELSQVGLESERFNVLYQPRRRFSLVINLSYEKVTISNYVVINNKTNEHKLEVKMPFPCTEENFYDKSFQNEVFDYVMKVLGFVEPTDDDVANVVPKDSNTDDLKINDKEIENLKKVSEVNADKLKEVDFRGD